MREPTFEMNVVDSGNAHISVTKCGSDLQIVLNAWKTIRQDQKWERNLVWSKARYYSNTNSCVVFFQVRKKKQ